MNADELTLRLRATGRFVFSYKQSEEDKQLPIPHQKARLKIHFEQTLEKFFNEAHIEPVANYRNEVERL